MADNLHYEVDREKCLSGLTEDMMDAPIVDLVYDLNALPHCFTLQCCYGHFVHDGNSNPHNLDPLPTTDRIPEVEYRIAYIAFCIENSDAGRELMEDLQGIPSTDPDNIQFCSAEWFWKRHINSYALQVEPDRSKHQDKTMLEYGEARHVEETRNAFFAGIRNLLNSVIKQKG